MKTLSANLILEKNKVGAKSAWLILVDIEVTVGTTLRYVANNENVTFDGNLYTALPLMIDSTKETSKGEIPSVNLSVSNITRVLRTYLESYDGLTGCDVTLYVVNSDFLAEDYSDLTLEFSVLETKVTEEWVSLRLGAQNPLRKRFPLMRYMAGQCNWSDSFKGVECKYAGSATVCDGSWRRCKELSNVANFGGYPGLDARGLYVV